MDPAVNEANAICKFEIYPDTIEDEFFLSAPLLAYYRDHAIVPFKGGTFMQAMFRYAPLIGGFYAPGGSFNLMKRQTIAALRFDTRYCYVSVPEYKEEIQVELKGDNAVASILEADMQNAVDTINAIVAVALAQNGQGARILAMNGWVEALNDGITPGWDGAVYAAYGGQTRNGAVGSALNSIPMWVGNPDGTAGQPQYDMIEVGYQDACRGKKEPNLAVGNKGVIARIKSLLVTQQRFAQERDPVWGVMGFRINNAMVLKDDYFPSLRYGRNDPVLGNFLTGQFASPGVIGGAGGGTADPSSNLPVINTVCTVGGVFCLFNTFGQ
jgi:hypothetical protein